MVICYNSHRKPRQILVAGSGAAITNTKNVEVLWNWVTGRGRKNFEVNDRKSLDCLEESVSRNMDIKRDFVESSEGS